MRTPVFSAVLVLALLVVRARARNTDLNAAVYTDRSPLTGLVVVVAREFLSRLEEIPPLERWSRDSSGVNVVTLARESAKLGIMAFMGYQGEDQCLERMACEAGELLRSFTASASFLFSAFDYVAPFHVRRYIGVARDAAEGQSCLFYRCGARPFE